MSVLFRGTSETAIFGKFLEVAIATSAFMKEVYNGWFPPEFTVSILKEPTTLIWDYMSETTK